MKKNFNESKKGQINSIIKETNFSTEAQFWYKFGFKVIPFLSGRKRSAVNRANWFKNLSVKKIHAHWSVHPDHELGCILGSDMIIFETNNFEYEHALTRAEEYFNLKPKLVVKTENGVQHYFRCAPGTILSSTYPLYFTDKIPIGIHVKTSGNLIFLPSSRGKYTSMLEAKNKYELSAVSQELIDEIYQLNGMISPSEIREQDKLKPCESDYDIQFDDFWVTVKLYCDAQDVDCDNCPVRPGFINLQHIRW